MTAPPCRSSWRILLLVGGALLSLGSEAGSTSSQPPTPPEVRLLVQAPPKENLDLLAPLLEGRLLTRLRERSDFRLVGQEREAPFTLLIEIQDLDYRLQGEYQRPYDAEADPNRLQYQQMLSGDMSIDLTLSRQGSQEPLYEDTMDFASSRKLDDPKDIDRLRSVVLDEIMERVSEKIPRLLKRRLKD